MATDRSATWTDVVTGTPTRGSKRSYQTERHVITLAAVAATGDFAAFSLQALVAPCTGGSIKVINTALANTAVITVSLFGTDVVRASATTAMPTTAAICILAGTAGITTNLPVTPLHGHVLNKILTNSNLPSDLAVGKAGDIWTMELVLTVAANAATDVVTIEILRNLLD